MGPALAAVYEAMRSGYGDPLELKDGGHDPSFVEHTAPLLEFLYSKYFRVSLEGLEHVPSAGPALLVANHSGGVPYDGAMLIYGLYRDHPQHRRLRTLVAHFAFQLPWMAGILSRIGAVRATTENGLELLERGELVGVFPEGLRGVGKLFRERYRLARFGRGGFARLARQVGVPMLPVAIVGAEEIHPMLGKFTTLPRRLGIPYVPITPTFPFLGPLGLIPVPTKWTIEIGPPIWAPPEGNDSQGTTAEIAERVRLTIEQMLARRLAKRRSVLFG